MTHSNYTIETFTEKESIILKKYFTNIDKPVFGLINLPDVVKGALFARYSRSNKSLRRLFLDEFYNTKQPETDVMSLNEGIDRASNLYDKMMLEYGDDSVAQLGGAHIACEQVSNILAKVLEKGRIASYLEQSTRYVYYHEKNNNQYNYLIPTELKDTLIRSEYKAYITELFNTYSSLIEKLTPILKSEFPISDNKSHRAWDNTIKAKACDIVRGLLPGATKTNLGIYASGQTYEYLLIKMFASKNEEVKYYANLLLCELRKIIPSFLKRVDLEGRGIEWSKYIYDIENEFENSFDVPNIQTKEAKNEIKVVLVDWNRNALNDIVKTILYEYSEMSDKELQDYINGCNEAQKLKILKKYIGDRQNRRHKPGRAFETIFYKFDIVADYGAFRDLQRHRILTLIWQKISPNNGYIIPRELEKYSDLRNQYEAVVIKAKYIYDKIKKKYGAELAQYCIPFAYNVRFMMNLNLREALHLIELRSQKQGHPSYRRVSLEMLELIEMKANHKFLTDAFTFVDKSPFYELSREDAENNIDSKIKSKK